MVFTLRVGRARKDALERWIHNYSKALWHLSSHTNGSSLCVSFMSGTIGPIRNLVLERYMIRIENFLGTIIVTYYAVYKTHFDLYAALIEDLIQGQFRLDTKAY